MVRRLLIVLLALLPTVAGAQELLLPAGSRGGRVPAVKASSTQVGLPFFDDFSGYVGAPDMSLWDSSGAAVNSGFAPLPPTIGVLTLDAYDAQGRLYPQASTSLFPADTVVSQPIRLDTLAVADSVVLSFFYLPGGGDGNMWERVGDCPEAADSLVLEFYCDSTWQMVWARGGVSVDTLIARTGHAWQYVAITLTEDRYFDSTFRFRFRNYCSLESDGKAGRTVGGDQWSIDYVFMDRDRSAASAASFRDIAFVNPAPSMLRHYRAMPARQFRAADMASQINLKIGNLFSSDLASHYGYNILDNGGNTLHSYDGGYENAPANGYQTVSAHASPTVNYTFEVSDTPRTYTVVHVVSEGSGGDIHRTNDTVVFTQCFDNYYAYDDGVAENGYGITSTSARIYLAYRFDLNVADTITAVDMFFNRTYREENESVHYYLTVWQADDQGRPGAVLYRDQAYRTPVTGDWHRYVLESEIVVDGSIFVGFEQVGNTYINLGFDRSFNSSDRIYYFTRSEWQQSILSGSLLLRPCFGHRATIGIGKVEPLTFTVGPNPASDEVSVYGLPEGSRVELYDMMGRRMMATSDSRLSTAELPTGLYLLRAFTPQGFVGTCKIMIQH